MGICSSSKDEKKDRKGSVTKTPNTPRLSKKSSSRMLMPSTYIIFHNKF